MSEEINFVIPEDQVASLKEAHELSDEAITAITTAGQDVFNKARKTLDSGAHANALNFISDAAKFTAKEAGYTVPFEKGNKLSEYVKDVMGHVNGQLSTKQQELDAKLKEIGDG